jgi:hypothetical protein
MTKSLLFFLILFFLGCAYHQDMTNNHVSESQVTEDTLKYKKLEKGFYHGPDGGLFIKTQSLISPPEEYGPDFYRPVPSIHIPTFELLCSQGWYAKDKDSVYVIDGRSDGKHIGVLENADASSFECINYRWGKDNNNVFENGIILQGLNPHSMIIVDADSSGFFQMVKDEDQVFFGHREISGIDVNSFNCERKDSTIIYQDKFWLYDKKYFLNPSDEYKTKK